MKVYVYPYLLLLYCCQAASAQQVSNVRATLDSTKATVSILYDLQETLDGQLFRVDLYSSHNNFSSPLLLTIGEVGDRITPGTDKQIIWGYKELISFNGQVSFEVRAVLTFSPFAVKTPTHPATYKRGSTVSITWQGGIASEQVNVELYREGEKIIPIALTNNRGEHPWSVPIKTKPGGKYRVKISSAARPDNFRLSETFGVRRRIPLVLKAVPIVLGAVGAYLLLDKDPPEDVLLPLPNLEGLPDK